MLFVRPERALEKRLSYSEGRKGWRGRNAGPGSCSTVPPSPAPTSPTKDGSSEVGSEVAKRLEDLEQWRRSLEQILKRQPTELERATKAVLTGAGPGKVFNPFD